MIDKHNQQFWIEEGTETGHSIGININSSATDAKQQAVQFVIAPRIQADLHVLYDLVYRATNGKSISICHDKSSPSIQSPHLEEGPGLDPYDVKSSCVYHNEPPG